MKNTIQAKLPVSVWLYYKQWHTISHKSMYKCVYQNNKCNNNMINGCLHVVLVDGGSLQFVGSYSTKNKKRAPLDGYHLVKLQFWIVIRLSPCSVKWKSWETEQLEQCFPRPLSVKSQFDTRGTQHILPLVYIHAYTQLLFQAFYWCMCGTHVL